MIALVALVEDLGSGSSTHMEAHSHLCDNTAELEERVPETGNSFRDSTHSNYSGLHEE